MGNCLLPGRASINIVWSWVAARVKYGTTHQNTWYTEYRSGLRWLVEAVDGYKTIGLYFMRQGVLHSLGNCAGRMLGRGRQRGMDLPISGRGLGNRISLVGAS